jgi:predicted phage tail protein
MCLRDFLLSPRYGLGKWFSADDIDVDSWNESADYCDEIITFHDSDGVTVKAKRYELNMVIDQQKTALEWLQEILANFAGFIVYSDAKLKLRIEKPTVTSYKFNDDNCINLKIEPLKLSETPNRYAVSIVDPLNNWSSIKAISEDLADQKMRQRIITKEVSLEGVTSQNQALRLARFYRDYNLVCPLQVSFTTGMQAMHLEPGDVVTLSYHDVVADMPIRINEIKETAKGTFEISGRQYNETIYGDDLGGGIQWHVYGGTSVDYNNTPPAITGVIAYTNTDNEILVEHDISTDVNFAEYRYYVEAVET